METTASLQPFLNIEEKSGYYFYRMIITMKTIFVLYAIENNIPKAWSFNSMVVCKLNVICMDPKMTPAAFIGLALNHFGLYFPQMAIMGMVSISYKSYECLLDVFVLLCLLYYGIETYKTETNKLFTVIYLTVVVSAYLNCLQSTELFQIGNYFVIVILYLLSFTLLLPTRRQYRQRLMYVYLIQGAWIFYKAHLHCSNAKLLAVETRNRTDVCMIVERSYEIDKCGLNETLENIEEFFIQSINMSNRKNYGTHQKVNSPVQSKKEVANKKTALVNKLKEYKLDKDAIFHMDADITERKISRVERQAAGEATSESIENTKTAQRYESITEPVENQVSTFDGEKSIFVKDNINIEEKPFEELRHRKENQLQSKLYLEGNINLIETRASVEPVQSGSEITEPQETDDKGEQIGNKATDTRNIEVDSLDETGVIGKKHEVTKLAIQTDELVTIKHQTTKSIDVSTTKIQDSSEKQIELTNGRKTTGTENTKTIISKTNKVCEYDSCKAIDPSTNNLDQASDSSANEFEQTEDSESRNIQFQTLEYSDKKERFQKEKETNTDIKSQTDLSNTPAKVHSHNVFRDKPGRYQANTFLGTVAIGSKRIILDDKEETELQATMLDQMAHDPETDLPTSKANRDRTTELPKIQTDETESSKAYKFLKDTQEYEFDHATSGDLRTKDFKSTTVSETTKINDKSTGGDKDENTHAYASEAKKFQASGTDKLETNESKFFQITQAEAVLPEPHSGNYPNEEFGNSTSEFRKTVAANKTELKAPKGNLPGTTERKSNQKEKTTGFVANEHETNKISNPKTKELETTKDIFSNEKEVIFFKTVDSEENLSSTKSVPTESIIPTVDNEKIRTQTRETTELKNNKIEISLTSKDNSVVLPTGSQIHNIPRKARTSRETGNKINKIEHFGASKYRPIKSRGIKLKPELREVNDVKNIKSKANKAHNIKVLEQATATNVASKTQLKEKEFKKDKSILPAIPGKLKHRLIGPPRPKDIKSSEMSNVGEHETELFNDNSDSIELKTEITYTEDNEHYTLAASVY